MELPPFPRRTAEWLAGFHRASPSTPLDAYCYVTGSLTQLADYDEGIGVLGWSRCPPLRVPRSPQSTASTQLPTSGE